MSPKTSETAAAGSGESTVTVLVALAANGLVAVAKTVAAVITGSASMVAESAHSWADTGNEVFLLLSNRRGNRAPDARHPLGYGRDAYVWALIAAFGLFAVGAAVSVMHGVQQLFVDEPATDWAISYVVLGVAFVLEGISFLQALRQARSGAGETQRDVLDYVLHTSDPTVRAVFFEDAAALIGLVIAFGGVLAHQLTGSSIPDAVGSILVGLLLAVVAIVLIQRNRRFIVGQTVDPPVRDAALARLLAHPSVASVSYLHIEYAGPGRVLLVAAVDIAGDEHEQRVARLLDDVEREVESSPRVVRAVLTLSAPGATPLAPAA